MNRKSIFKFLLIAVLAVLIFFLAYSRNTQEIGSSIVVLTKDGFLPKELEINKGGKVIFKSKLKNPFWPTSFLYVLNKAKPEKEPSSPVKSSDTISLVFSQIGEWHYYNKSGPRYSQETGTIKVIENGIVVKPKITQPPKDNEDCEADLKDKNACWEDLIKFTISSKGLPEALQIFNKRYEAEPVFRVRCNEFARKMGGIAYRYLGASAKNYLSEELSFCNYGYYIGFLDALMSISGNLKEATLFCDTVREKFSVSSPHTYLECLKGLSQTIISRFDLEGNWKEQIVKASDFCQKTAKNNDELNICKVGVFSAFTNDLQGYLVEKYGVNILPDMIKNPFQYCLVIKDEDKPQCYGGVAAWMIWSGIYDFKSAVSLTENITDKDLSVRTIRALAKISISKSDEQSDDLIITCRLLQKELSKQCLISLIQGKMELGKPGKEYEDGLNLCRIKVLTEEERQICIKFVIFDTVDIQGQKDKLDSICELLDAKSKKYCSDYKLNFFQL